MNWLITGGCGFIGTSLIQYLLNQQTQDGSFIRVLDNLTVGTKADLASVCSFTEAKGDPAIPKAGGVELIVGDIRDEAVVLRATRDMDVIIHLAANTGVQPSIQNPRMDCLTNVVGTFNCLEGARLNGVKNFVFASSGGTVIGDCEPPIHEEMVPHPKSPYGASKSACEGYCSAYHGSFGINTVALRFSNVYGPGSTHKNSVVAKFIRNAFRGEVLEIYGDGKQTRDFIFIEDLVRAVYLSATTNGIGGHVFQIATARETTVNEVAELLMPILESSGAPKIRLSHAHALPGEIKRNFSDTSKAKQLLNWQAEVDLPDGLKRTVSWFQTSSAKVPA